MTWRNTPPARVMQCTWCGFKCLCASHFELVIVVSINGWIMWRGERYSLATPAGRLKTPIADSNPAGGTDGYLLWVLCVVRDLCVGLITCPEESYWVWCVVTECDREASIMRRPWPTRGCFDMKKKNSIHSLLHSLFFACEDVASASYQWNSRSAYYSPIFLQ